MAVLLTPVVRYWRCPSCDLTVRIERSDIYTQFHPCPALDNVNLPLVEIQNPDDKPDGRHRLIEREDYAHDPTIGRFASISTDHGDGSNDLAVLAPTARLTVQ
jgi:hypothetical protein